MTLAGSSASDESAQGPSAPRRSWQVVERERGPAELHCDRGHACRGLEAIERELGRAQGPADLVACPCGEHELAAPADVQDTGGPCPEQQGGPPRPSPAVSTGPS